MNCHGYLANNSKKSIFSFTFATFIYKTIFFMLHLKYKINLIANIGKVCFGMLICVFLGSCSTKKEVIYEGASDDLSEERLLDTLVVTPEDIETTDQTSKTFRSSATLVYDILHTKLDLKFDWSKSHVLGKAALTITPYFKPLDSLVLDAVGFDIHHVRIANTQKELIYKYDGTKLTVVLDRRYQRKENFILDISYTAKPDENLTSGSEAITSDKGLFFIDPLGIDPDLPTQIWTQGETENNSRWFPTFDKPNERFTQEIILTVDDKYNTLSNGRKISSIKNPDGTRTDHWKLEKPHTVYLAMIAVGEYHEEMEMWNNIPLHYMVEKGFGKHAKKIFNHTPDMMAFFTQKLNYPYPWEKYGQVVVREFVSGAMENTGAVVFGDFVQKTERELIDNDNDYIVAHEMMHHWFGNLVTCEDWSNLTLNEGFANYAEYLWFEHKYGKDRAEKHRMDEMNGYYSQVFGGSAHPLVHYYYGDKEQMFDAHSYNKGGLVLHMLRNYLGDDIFFESLNRYLTNNAFTAVEVDELRMAFEDVSGEDLNWFFDQWFLGTGHPFIDVKYTYNKENKVLLLETDMFKTPENFYQKFRLPVDVALYYADGSVSYHSIVVTDKQQRFLIEELKNDPVTYVFDGKNVLLGLINENKTEDQYKAQFQYSPYFMDKVVAISNINNDTEKYINQALTHPYYFIRTLGIQKITDTIGEIYINKLQDLVLADPHSEVRKEALIRLANMEDFDAKAICRIVINSEKAYPVLQVALEVLGAMEDDKNDEYIQRFINDESDFLCSTLVGMMKEPTVANLAYLQEKSTNINVNYMFDFYTRYQEFLQGKKLSVLEISAEHLQKIASQKDGNMFRKYLAMGSLIKIAEDLTERSNDDLAQDLLQQVSMMIFNVATNETNPILREKYEGIK